MPIVCYKFGLVLKELEGLYSQITFIKFLASFQITFNIISININIIYVLVDIRIYHHYNPGIPKKTFIGWKAWNQYTLVCSFAKP